MGSVSPPTIGTTTSREREMATNRKSSILTNRKLSTDFARKLSAIPTASDVSCISQRFGMEQGHLKNIVQDILEMDLNDEWEIGSDDGLSEYGEDGNKDDMSIWQELRNENVKLDSRKSSSSSEASTDSLDSA